MYIQDISKQTKKELIMYNLKYEGNFNRQTDDLNILTIEEYKDCLNALDNLIDKSMTVKE
jgi:hypothetical protein